MGGYIPPGAGNIEQTGQKSRKTVSGSAGTQYLSQKIYDIGLDVHALLSVEAQQPESFLADPKLRVASG